MSGPSDGETTPTATPAQLASTPLPPDSPDDIGRGRPAGAKRPAYEGPSVSFSFQHSPGPSGYSTEEETMPGDREAYTAGFSPASMTRPPRLPRNNSTSGHPVTYPAALNSSSHPYHDTSRSASRARPPIPQNMSTAQLQGLVDDDPIIDRGEDLIKRRQAERKKLRRAKSRANDEPETPGPDDSFGYRSFGPSTGRSVSRSRMPSARKQFSEGLTSYAGSVADDTRSFRPPSINSAADEEEQQDMIDEVVADVVDEAGEEDEEEDVEDEGVTVRDRQDAINIEHPFGLPIWKPALYRKSRSITRNAESALHSIPSAAAERHLLPGNLAWTILFGWWLALVCLAVAILVSFAEVFGGGRGGYGTTVRGLAWYIWWPFGKYVEGEGAPDQDQDDDTPQAPVPTDETPLLKAFRRPRNRRAKKLGRVMYWPLFFLVLAPIMLAICTICWGLVFTIPMAKLNWALLKLLWSRPLEINFRAAPASDDTSPTRAAKLQAGQMAPTAGPASTVLLCVYRAIGLEYYKYTVGGVNILFINLLPLVFFVIFDGFVILPYVEKREHEAKHVSPLLVGLANQWFIFILSLSSVIPLSYFIGMAVASISAQSSIGMGAVINATFGSIIEIILYGIALIQGKGRLVEGSVVGSILAGVLLMPGASMCSGAIKRKEQKFNAKSAGVTSTMLIMAIIGTLTPTMFYQIYGSIELRCEGCPPMGHNMVPEDAWKCKQCYYEHPDPIDDPFYQSSVKHLMYACAGILLFSYLIGLWFSLRTHASQIWQNPQQLMKAEEQIHPALKASLSQRINPAVLQHILPLHKDGKDKDREPPTPTDSIRSPKYGTFRLPRLSEETSQERGQSSHASGLTPFLDPSSAAHPTPMRLPSTLTTEDFTRAVAVATVSALKHQRSFMIQGTPQSVRKMATSASGPVKEDKEEEEEAHGGHEGPSWNRGISAGVLLGCTMLYAMIAEILVDVVDVVLQGSKIDEKFLGLTLFTLIPNTTEFMNAVSFAMQGNIALSMEIGSAYALQVCLLQIPAMVAFSALYDPGKMGEVVDTFTLIFPRWDVIAIILSIFLLTYTYIEARANYHRGSVLVLAYLVLIMGFYYAPTRVTTDGNDFVADAVGGGVWAWLTARTPT